MGTTTERRLKSGQTVYTAQIRIMRDGKKASVSSTFDRRAVAEAWMMRKTAEAAKPGGFTALQKVPGGATLADAIRKYTAASAKQLGKTKEQVLKAILSHSIAALPCDEIRSPGIVAFAQALAGGGRKPQTVGNYLSHLSAAFAIAKPAWGLELDRSEMDAALIVCRALGLVAKSKGRDRRHSITEMDALTTHFGDGSRRARAMPMQHVTAFALCPTRCQAEIVAMRWADLEPGRVLVRDMKHPDEKAGNNIWVDLPPEAERIIHAMPRTSERIFPYSTDAVTANFTRACKLLGIEDLHFHGLRHESVSRLVRASRAPRPAPVI